MLSKKLRATLKTALLTGLLFIAFVLLLNSLIEKPSVQRFLLSQLSKSIGYKLTVARVELTLWGGIGINARDLKATSFERSESFEASRVRVVLHTGELVMGRVIPSKIHLFQPKIDMAVKEAKGRSNVETGPVLKELIIERLSKYRTVTLEKAHIRIRNFPFELKDLYFFAQQGNETP